MTPKELRDVYFRASLRQRYKVARDRIEHANIGPSLLVNVVSALEGFSRAIAVRALTQAGNPLDEAYGYVRDAGAIELISKHVCPWLRTTPAKAFGAKVWQQIPDAVKWRNVLIHEAMFLNGGTCTRLRKACEHCLDRLAVLSGAA